MNLRLNLRYLALLAAAIMLTVVMAFTASAIIESQIASAKPSNAEYKHPNAGGGNDSECATQPCDTSSDVDPGNAKGGGGSRGGHD
jgi:hypothetical protein